MGEIRDPQSVMLVLVACSRYDEALKWIREQAINQWGPLALESSLMPFVETDYYQSSMGDDLRKQFLAFETLIDPARLAEIKIQTNRWEEEYNRSPLGAEPRPLNLDPGYLEVGKFVLASTKNHLHRIYLSNGIYAEVTLHFQDGQWKTSAWTYPDYKREDYQAFLTKCRNDLKQRLRAQRDR